LSKLRLAVVLPVLQCCLGVLLLLKGYEVAVVGTDTPVISASRVIYIALNAPATPVKLLDLLLPYGLRTSMVMGLYSDDYLLLVGAGLLWFYVGRAWDRRKLPPAWRPLRATVRSAVFASLGVFVAFFGVSGLRTPLASVDCRAVAAGICFAWSLVLLAAAALGLRRRSERTT